MACYSVPEIVTLVRQIAPQFSDAIAFPDSIIEGFIQIALLESSYCKAPCSKQNLVLAYYTAHLMTQSSVGSKSPSGQLKKKEKVGQVEVEYETGLMTSTNPTDLYYLKYKMLTKGYTRMSPIVSSGNA